MAKNIKQLIDEYVRWLRAGISYTKIGDVFEVTTPFLDRHNDHIQIYVRPEKDRFVLSDDGYVLADLQHSGCSLDSPRRQALLQSVLNGFGVTRVGEELIAVANNGDFPQRKHAMIQAILAVGDLFATAKQHVHSFFLEDVATFLDSIGARAVRDFQLVGKSGFQHKMDFAIPKSPRAPERLVRVVNRPTRDAAGLLIFAWTDIRAIRPDPAHMYAMLNDSDARVGGETVDALRQYDVVPVIWSDRSRHEAALAA